MVNLWFGFNSLKTPHSSAELGFKSITYETFFRHALSLPLSRKYMFLLKAIVLLWMIQQLYKLHNSSTVKVLLYTYKWILIIFRLLHGLKVLSQHATIFKSSSMIFFETMIKDLRKQKLKVMYLYVCSTKTCSKQYVNIKVWAFKLVYVNVY